MINSIKNCKHFLTCERKLLKKIPTVKYRHFSCVANSAYNYKCAIFTHLPQKCAIKNLFAIQMKKWDEKKIKG